MSKFVEDEEEQMVEIDDVSYVGFDVISKNNDHFKKVDIHNCYNSMLKIK